MNAKVASVIVAYNNPGEISNLLEKIGLQTIKSKILIVVDNSTSDKFKNENVEECKNFKDTYNIDVMYVSTNCNIGSASGFALGMQLTDNKDIEFVWLHDQDGYPEKNCLENLLKYNEMKDIGIIAPIIKDFEDNEVAFLRCEENVFGRLLNVEIDSKYKIITIAGTVGILVKYNLIKNIGVYDGKHFFVGLEDVEYSLRCKKSGFKILLVKDAIYRHPDFLMKRNYNIKASYLKKVLPLNFSNVKNNEANGYKNLSYSNTYINYKYYNLFTFYINLYFSLFSAFLDKYKNGNVNYKATYDLYKKGINDAKFNDNTLYKGYEYKAIIEKEILI